MLKPNRLYGEVLRYALRHFNLWSVECGIERGMGDVKRYIQMFQEIKALKPEDT